LRVIVGIGGGGAGGGAAYAAEAAAAAGEEELTPAQIARIEAATDPLRSRGPIYFPPSRAGFPGEVRDARDVARYLAFHEGGSKVTGMRDAPTSNQDLYDAQYYGLDLSLNPATRILTGVVTVRVTVVAGPLTQVDLNLASNLTVSAVTSGGTGATFSRPVDFLNVTLDRSYATDETVELVVSYSGNPSSGDAFDWGFIGGRPMISTLSEPFGARTWFPCKDHPEDKADSVDVRVTAPTGLVIASNGTLRDESDNGVNSFAWWHESYPITTYLISLAIHPYAVSSDWYVPTPSDSMEIVFYDFPSEVGNNAPTQALVKDMLGVFAGKFGEYPFLQEKYGHAQFLWGGGMEHQTCSSMGFYGESIVAHELMHQWFGDAVTCKTFEHIWLNEGFATYGEALWQEATYGPEAYLDDMLLSQYFGPGTVYCPPTEDFGRIFDSNLSYNKAAWVLHMLRGVLGDAEFFEALLAYRTTFEGGSADTEDFQGVVEASSGQNLDAFFQQWIYGEGAPTYAYEWTVASAGGGFNVTVDIDQVQSGQIFTMPLHVRVETVTGPEEFIVINDAASETYVLYVDSEPLTTRVDPDHWVLRILLEPIPEPTFEKGILLVNGVDWSAYGSEITSAYQDETFWGAYDVDFWDYFEEPNGGYPSTLPAPTGHGVIPAEVLAQYRNVIWVGNNFGGDLNGWYGTPIYSYLQAGGNVLLLARQGESFLFDQLRSYLGINWVATTTITDCIAQQPGLTNIARLGTQSSVATFTSPVVFPALLLYEAEAGFTPDRGIGVLKSPLDSGRFAFLSGRPYRWNHAALRTNVEYILANYFQVTPTDAPDGADGAAGRLSFALAEARPNPFGDATEFSFALPSSGPTSLRILDVTGREVRSLVSGARSAGQHRVSWDGRDTSGGAVGSGVYFARLDANGKSLERKLLRLR